MIKKYFSEDNVEIENVVDDKVYQEAEDALFKNSSPRCPVILIVDTSGSMRGSKIQEVNRGVNGLIDYINDDKNYICKKRVELAIITFDDRPTIYSDFSPAETKEKVDLKAGHNTFMVPALELALEMIQKRKDEYNRCGRKYFRPLVLFLTDGGPSDNLKIYQQTKEKIYGLSKARKLAFFAIKIGREYSEDAELRHSQLLEGFDPTIPAGRLELDKFGEFFKWLSASVSSVSSSNDTDTLNIQNPEGWWKSLAS